MGFNGNAENYEIGLGTLGKVLDTPRGTDNTVRGTQI
jgi:hypothetical protein